MTRILLIRHGQTEWNRQEIFRGRADIPLSDTGLTQARYLAESLAGEQIMAIYCSPLSRAYVTAELLAVTRDVAPQKVDGFVDISYGEWEGRQHEDVKQHYPELYAQWKIAPQQVGLPGGETPAAVRERTVAALDELAARHRDATVAVVSHRVVNKLILCHALGLGNDAFWRIRQSTCCLNVLEWERARTVVSLLNDTCHLRGLEEDASDF
jgi:broad specificity phosphatase PhoE